MKKSGMMGITTTFLTVLLFFSFTVNAQFRVVGYVTNWGNLVQDLNNVDYTKVTHINIAFINPDTSGTLSPTTSLSNATQIVHSNNAKILASLGGASAPACWTQLKDATHRTAFITKIVNFVNTYNFDGIDIDLEGAAIDGTYNDFIIALSAALKPSSKLLSAAVASWDGSAIYDNTLAVFDYINIMSYDKYGTWTGPGQHAPYDMAESDLNYWGQSRGLAKNKLVLGLPSYGYSWETNASTSMTFQQIANKYPRAIYQDSINTTTNGVIYYNGISTIKQKTSLALQEAGGTAWWTLQYDYLSSDSRSLVGAMDEVIKASSSNIPPKVSMKTPSNKSVFTEGDSISISVNASDTDGTVSFVSFYAGSLKLGQTSSVPYKMSWNTAGPGTYKIYGKAVDNDYTTSVSDTITIVVNASKVQLPFGGTAWNIPGKIEAENYDIGDTLAYDDSSVGNSGGVYRSGNVDIESCTDDNGGYDVGWTVAGEWLEYTVNVRKDTLYDFLARVASPNSGKYFNIQMDGVNIGTFNIPNTGDWQKWQTVKISGVALSSGQKIMRVAIDAGDFNLNYVNVVYVNSTSAAVVSLENSNNIKIYPNPFTDQLTVNFGSSQKGLVTICLYDLSGKQVIQKILSEGEHMQILDVSTLSQGIYTCVINSNENVSVLKVVKQ